ncbi:MAG: hypothetical protein O7G83_09665, partial [Proteobacteria bacterium]|nr:hypothetical protein [Pseudomonadota bacterium]
MNYPLAGVGGSYISDLHSLRATRIVLKTNVSPQLARYLHRLNEERSHYGAKRRNKHLSRYIRLNSMTKATLKNLHKSGRLIAIALTAVLLGCWNADQAQNHVQFVGTWGSEGTKDGQFLYIEDFAFSSNGNLLVTDALRADVQIFAKDGKFLGKFGTAKFEKPEGVAVAPNGNIFVADYLTGYIKVFDSGFKYLRKFSGLGDGAGETIESEFMSISRNALLYVAEAGNHRISVFALDGNFKFSFGQFGHGDGQMNRPEAAKTGP